MKKIIIILVVIVILGLGMTFIPGLLSAEPVETVEATPTPIAEKELVVTFDRHGGYTIIDVDSVEEIPKDVLAIIKEENISRKLISFFPTTLTLFGTNEITTLSEISSAPERTCLHSIRQNDIDYLIYEVVDHLDSHVLKGKPAEWLKNLKKEMFFYYGTMNFETFPEEAKLYYTYMERLFTDCLSVKKSDTGQSLYSVGGKKFPISKVEYIITLAGKDVAVHASYVADIDGRILEFSKPLADELSSFTLSFDGLPAEDSLTEDGEVFIDEVSKTADNTEPGNDQNPTALNMPYSTYGEFQEYEASKFTEFFNDYARPVTAEMLECFKNIYVGDYNVVIQALNKKAEQERDVVLNSVTDSGEAEAYENANVETEPAEESQPGFIDRILALFRKKTNGETDKTDESQDV